MRPLIRCTIVCSISDPPELLLQNLIALDKSGLVPDIREEQVIWDMIRRFARAHQHVPEAQTLRVMLADERDLQTLDYLQQMVGDPLKVRGDFAVMLERTIEANRNVSFLEINRRARAIATTGLELDGENLRGTDAALKYERAQLRKLDRAPSGIKISGEVIGDTAGMIADYDRAKTAPITGNFCGLRQLDMTIGGSKNKELWVHAAYSGHLKSTFALNWAYHLAIFYQTSSVFFSLEMNYEQVRRQLATMHSFHFKFRDVRARLGLQNEQTGDVGLDYAKVRKGTLPPKEEEFYRNYVVPDLDDERNGYGRIHVEVRDPNQTQYTLEDMQEAAERIYEQDPFRKVFVDHSLLLDSRERRINTSDRVAEVLKDLKNLARGFRGGAGTDITVLHQINRPGYADALRKKEQGLLPRYNPTNLSQSSGTEQNADVITTSWIDEDLRRKHHILFDCLKAREDDLVPPFLANVRWPCPRVVTCAEQITVVPASGTTAAKRRAPKIVGTEVFNILGAQTTPAQA